MKLKKMPYSLWKRCYNQFSAHDYDTRDKTIMVELPDTKRPSWPKEWTRHANHLLTPGGCDVCFWNTGVAENFTVDRYISYYNHPSRTIIPGIDSRERVMQTVEAFEKM